MRFRADPSSLRGSIAPVVTPFTADGELDTEGLRRLIGWQLDSGSHGISLGGSTGEPSAQTPEERIAAMTEAARVIADRVPFLPGTGSARLDETLELTAAAADLGADAALVITPYYARPTQEGLFQWYATVAGQNPDLPIVVYNVPSRTAVDIAPETIARLRRRYGNVVGVKETTRDFEHFSRVLHQCGRDLLVWSGIELLCLPLLALGGVGFVSAVANRVYAQVAAGGAADVDRAARAARCAFTDGPWPAMAARQRARVLNRIADGIERRGARIAELETFDTGLPVTQARGQAERAGENFRFFADMIVTLHEDAFRTGTSQLGYVIRKPAGPAGLITPWNTPFMLETWKLAPSLAAGCPVILKPAEWSPLSASLLPEIMTEAGVPDGVFNMVHG